MPYLDKMVNHEERIVMANMNANQAMGSKRFESHQGKAFSHEYSTSMHDQINQLILYALIIVIGGGVSKFSSVFFFKGKT